MIQHDINSARLGVYDPEHALICLDDEDASLLVDISLCLSGYASYPWLREHNSVVMVIGYLETLNHSSGDVRAHDVFSCSILSLINIHRTPKPRF